MFFKDSFETALNSLKLNRSRTALTILGIVIGICAIMMVMSLGQGAQDLILGQIQSMGSKIIGISPGKKPKGIMDSLSTFTDSLKNKDLKLLENKSNVPHAQKIMPVVFGSETMIFENQKTQPIVFGVTDLFSKIYNAYPDQGRIFTEDELKSHADVVVIGAQLKDDLFGNNDGLNQKVKIKERNFRVIGVLAKKGQSSFVNFDNAAIVPYTTAQQYLFGIKYFNRLAVEVDTEANIERTVEDIKITLRNAHNIDAPANDDFFIETQADAMNMVSTIMNVLTLFLAAVAAISLIVGGVGIMNIMLVSVTERTREIGLRKAIGATSKNIMTQFLIESVTLTATGGLIGIILGVGLSSLVALAINKFAGLAWGYSFPFGAAILGLGVAGAIGLIFGIYPARQAAKKNPIEALRYE